MFAGARLCSVRCKLKATCEAGQEIKIHLKKNTIGKARSLNIGETSFMFKEAGALFCYCVIKLDRAVGNLGSRKGQEEK